MARVLTLLYAVIAYAVFFVTFLYAIGFVGGFGPVPNTLDGMASGPVGTAVLIDLVLLGLFGLQHSIMARPGFKRAWTKVVPKAAERSTYVLLASLILLATFTWWRPISGTVWSVRNGTARDVIWAVFAAGWAIVFLGTWMIDHWGLFGLRQAWTRFRGQEFRHPPFQTRGFYKFVRHPLMLGFIIAFWATPTMTYGHLLFAGVSTAYILVALRFEERDLLTYHGDAYREYRRTTPGLIPGLGGGGSAPAAE
ncbi:MAG TPA: isoprenylcysteine carboxylmethyltransferase family protein [Gemmatimonadota bacterium]|nr:isoprenylcysteine carboxylmethyltransferase family protein [Gemmatimonadota bacterium]